jgi:hypothetical protein
MFFQFFIGFYILSGIIYVLLPSGRGRVTGQRRSCL